MITNGADWVTEASLDSAEEIHHLCNAFDSAWRQGLSRESRITSPNMKSTGARPCSASSGSIWNITVSKEISPRSRAT